MNQTTNYNFNVPVGSDIVNPLVQDFPNWESLDTILRNIANTGITTATHTKSGTIHTLTFTDTTVPMIRFQATADFNTNDTFTVNGLSVSALTVTGEALPDGAFVIGSMVLCELRDNLLTVYTSGTDANTLDGHPASYFATASDLDNVDDKADANKLLIDQINSDLAVKSTSYDWNQSNVFYATSEDSTSTLRIRKTGNVIYAHFNLITKQAVAANTLYTVATVTDSAFIPTYRSILTSGLFSGSLFTGNVKVFFNADGTIQVMFDAAHSATRQYVQCDLITIKE